MNIPDFSAVSDFMIYLVPGFFAAWVFHSLTAHKKENQFERIVQALIFGLIVTIINSAWAFILSLPPSGFTFGEWTREVEATWAILWGVVVGTGASYLANSDYILKFLRDKDFTRRISYPSEWYAALYEHRGWIVLHLKDERRLHGWAALWPSDPQKGHFYIQQPSWIVEGVNHKIEFCSGIMISAKDVQWLELIGDDIVQ